MSLVEEKTQVHKPGGFAVVAGLCIVWGGYGLISRAAVWLLPFGKSLPSRLSADSSLGVFLTITDLCFLIGGIYVLKKKNLARHLVCVAAFAKVLEWIYSAITYSWLLSVPFLVNWSLPSLIIALIIAIYFSRSNVKTYMQ